MTSATSKIEHDEDTDADPGGLDRRRRPKSAHHGGVRGEHGECEQLRADHAANVGASSIVSGAGEYSAFVAATSSVNRTTSSRGASTFNSAPYPSSFRAPCSIEVYFPHVIRLMGLEETPDHPAAQAARDEARQYCRRMERVLADREFLAESYSYADIAFYMAQLFGARKGAPMTAETPNLLAWRERMTAGPAVRKVAGAMADYLASIDHPVPDFLRGLY